MSYFEQSLDIQTQTFTLTTLKLQTLNRVLLIWLAERVDLFQPKVYLIFWYKKIKKVLYAVLLKQRARRYNVNLPGLLLRLLYIQDGLGNARKHFSVFIKIFPVVFSLHYNARYIAQTSALR